MATFRCLASGQTVTFTLQHDIDSMKGHSGYVRIDEPEQDEQQSNPLNLLPPTVQKSRGRPRKMENVGN